MKNFAMLSLVLSVSASLAAAPATSRKGSLPLVGKPSAPVSLTYQVTPKNPQPGETALVQLQLQVQEEGADVKLRARANERVSIIEGEKEMSLGNLAAGESRTETLHVLVKEAGNAYVHVRLSGRFDGRPQSRMMSIPITQATRAGDAEKDVGTLKRAHGKPPGGAAKSSSGKGGSSKASSQSADENVISMPAGE